MKKIGIFLAFAPEQPITNQGIGRLTAFILSALLKNDDVKVFIAAPAWYKTIIAEFLADQRISISKIELITTDGIPLLLRIRSWVKRFADSRNENKYKEMRYKLRGRIQNFNLKLLIKGLSTTSLLKFILISMLILLIGLPLVLLGMASVFFLKVMKRGMRFLESRFGWKINLKPKYLFAPLSTFRRNIFVHRLYQGVRRTELNRLIQKINVRKDIDMWYVPTLFWPEIENIQAKKIVAAPDVVFLEFPLLFANPFFGMISEQIAKTIQVADHLICYSDHVKQKHLIDGYFLDTKQISVVKHGGINLRSFLELPQNGPDGTRHAAYQILRNYQQSHLIGSSYLKDFDFTSTHYIFYSSQIRPHKNFMSLVKAYEKLLRNRFVNIKLITTADLTHDDDVWNYVQERRLQYDVLSFPGVSSEVLAALNHLAICAVNPTLFEGGFPFTFTEAYSVGTPSMMSRIPVVLDEVTDPMLQEKMLFDPYNVEDIVNKIEWAIQHRDELLALEEPLYRKLAARTWEMVADEYVDVFKSISGKQHEAFA